MRPPGARASICWTIVEAAFFDLDKTVIAKASMMAFGGPFYRQGLVSRRTIVRGVWSHLIYLHLGASEEKLARMRESMLALTRGWERARVEEIVGEALDEVVTPIIYAEAAELMAEHRAAGRLIVIVSASPEEIVVPLARHLGVDRVIASRACIGDDGRYTGAMEFYAYGPLKVEAMRALAESEGIDLSRSVAYSDSYTDLPMLEAVGSPVVVNPDRPLLKVARDREWEIRQFERLMPLGAPRNRAVPAAVAVGTGAVALSALAWWRLRSARAAAGG